MKYRALCARVWVLLLCCVLGCESMRGKQVTPARKTENSTASVARAHAAPSLRADSHPKTNWFSRLIAWPSLRSKPRAETNASAPNEVAQSTEKVNQAAPKGKAKRVEKARPAQPNIVQTEARTNRQVRWWAFWSRHEREKERFLSARASPATNTPPKKAVVASEKKGISRWFSWGKRRPDKNAKTSEQSAAIPGVGGPDAEPVPLGTLKRSAVPTGGTATDTTSLAQSPPQVHPSTIIYNPFAEPPRSGQEPRVSPVTKPSPATSSVRQGVNTTTALAEPPAGSNEQVVDLLLRLREEREVEARFFANKLYQDFGIRPDGFYHYDRGSRTIFVLQVETGGVSGAESVMTRQVHRRLRSLEEEELFLQLIQSRDRTTSDVRLLTTLIEKVRSQGITTQ